MPQTYLEMLAVFKIGLFTTTRRRHVQLSLVIRHFSRAAREHENFGGTLFLATDAGFQGQQCPCDTQENSSAALRVPSALSWASSLCSSTSEIPKERIPSSQLVTIRYWVFLAASALHQALQRHFALLWTVVFDWGGNHDLIHQIGLWDWFHSKEMAGAPGNLVVLSKKRSWIQLQGKEPPMSAFPSTPKSCPYAKETGPAFGCSSPKISPLLHTVDRICCLLIANILQLWSSFILPTTFLPFVF